MCCCRCKVSNKMNCVRVTNVGSNLGKGHKILRTCQVELGWQQGPREQWSLYPCIANPLCGCQTRNEILLVRSGCRKCSAYRKQRLHSYFWLGVQEMWYEGVILQVFSRQGLDGTEVQCSRKARGSYRWNTCSTKHSPFIYVLLIQRQNASLPSWICGLGIRTALHRN